MPQPMTAVIVPAIAGTARKGRASGEGTQGGERDAPGSPDPRLRGGDETP